MTMNPYLSWAIVLVFAGGLGLYYNAPKLKNRTPVRLADEKTENVLATKKQKRKVKKTPESSVAPVDRTVRSPGPESKSQEADKPDEDIDSKEMAKRFAAVRNGTSQLGSDNAKSQKSKKDKKAAALTVGGSNDRSGSHVSTPASSTTGADADDDLSSAESPNVNASARDVSDMLEAPPPGASVLRVTGSVDDQPKKQKPQSFKPVETKKQRQQKAKNEARKAQVQEAEEQRRKLLEKQLHSARESERREAAKSQPAIPTNAWQTKGNAVNGVPKAAEVPKMDLLDTFGDEAPSAAPSTTSPSKKWAQGLPSEDEQMRMLGAANGQDEWTTVSSRKLKKKGAKAEESASEASASESQPTPAPMPAQPKITVTPTYVPDILRSQQKGHPLDSDWAA